jgi:hypothetical protein
MAATNRSDAVSGSPNSEFVDPNANAAPAPAEISDDATYVVDGQQLTGSELRASMLRQADYTRKTQTLAQERRQYEAAAQLLNSLQTNPQGTLAQLAQHFGVQMGGNEPSPNFGYEPEEEVDDPRIAALEARQQEFDAFQEQQLEQQADQFLQQKMQEVHGLAEQLGIEVDEEELFSFAFQNNYVDPVAAFLTMNAQDLPTRAKERAVEEYTAKRGLPISRTSRFTGNTRQAQPRPAARNMQEALQMALEEAGVGDLSEVETIPLFRQG